jgi:butyrate kinase
MRKFKVFAINPGSTSTKIALFENEDLLFSENISHDENELRSFTNISDQMPYRRDIILKKLEQTGFDLTCIDAFSGRGGGLISCESGVYEINEELLHQARTSSVRHPAVLGSQLADVFSRKYGGKAFVVNPPSVDEFSDLARITGFKELVRESAIHALNHKEVGIRYAHSVGKKYEEMNLIVAHLGGGISVAAHQQGKMIDSNDNIRGDGPMTPTRSGALPAVELINLCFSGNFTEKELLERVMKHGGWLDHLGTADGLVVSAMINEGNGYAKLVMDATIYQICKTIGSCATVLEGKVEAIIITGGLAHDKYLTSELKRKTGFIAPLTVIAGEFEMEALASGAIRVLTGEEKAKIYTGRPAWAGFNVSSSMGQKIRRS